MAPPLSDLDSTRPTSQTASDKTSKREKRWSHNTSVESAPTSFFLKSHEQFETEQAEHTHEAGLIEDSMFGVQSLKDTINAADRIEAQQRDATIHDTSSHSSQSDTAFSATMPLRESNVSSESRAAPASGIPLACQSLAHLAGSPLSTPKSASIRSLHLSDDDLSADEGSSQALASSDEGEHSDEYGPQYGHDPLDEDVQDGIPQLVMPSISMPSRRPFTEKGKNMGKLKIMVVGGSGSGKTGLIRSMVQACEDIVHVDPLEPSTLRIPNSMERTPSSHKVTAFAEIHASTRPYPSWWAEVDESRVLKRRKSVGETVLERNISFIDTPGFDDRLSFERNTSSILDYIQAFLHRNASIASLSESDLLGILCGNGGFQVDLVLYLLPAIQNGIPAAAELAFIKRLSRLTNLIPISSKADLCSTEHLAEHQSKVAESLRSANVSPFDLRKFGALDVPQDTPHLPFAVSSATSKYDDNMDASLLMSSGYMTPLEPSQLPDLISAIFAPDMAACLRHSASRKYINWHRNYSVHAPSMSLNTIRPGRLQSRAVSSPSPPPYDGSLISSASGKPYSFHAQRAYSDTTQESPPSSLSSPLFPLVPTTNPYALARITDHTQREERLVQVHLARWASDLQRALRNERARFAALQDAERQAWLHARLDEVVSADAATTAVVAKAATRRPSLARLHAQDPLGLLRWRQALGRRGALLARVVGGAGVVGAIVLWVLRTWEWELDVVALDGSSWRSWGASWPWSRE